MSNKKTVLQFTIVFIFILSILSLQFLSPTYSQSAQELEDIINQKEEELNKQKSYLSDIEKRIKEISGSNYSLTEKVNLLNAEITKLQTEIDKRNIEIEEKLKIISEKEELLVNKKGTLDLISSQLYMKSRYNKGQLLFSFSNLDQMLQTIFVKKSAINILTDDIEKITGEFVNLVELKESLENEKRELDEQKQDLDKSYKLVLAEKKKVQAELSAQIATKSSVSRRINGLTTELSDLQYQLILARQGGTYVSPDVVPTSGDPKSTLQGFLQMAPSGSFQVFSIGAYTHRNGMSQWGARARADAGQSYQQILSAYYPNSTLSTGTIETITVKFCKSRTSCSNCTGEYSKTYNFEYDYLYRLGEMPESFHLEALKAQAISARTYALNATNYGANSIWGDECGQVVAGQKTGTWKTAVDLTRNVVMNRNGRVFSAQYAAVHGGWGNEIGWDVKEGSGDWMPRAWDNISKVSWFYKGWYRANYSESSSTCGRNPWLSQPEMSDILNAYQVWKAKGGKDSRIVPIPDACHPTQRQIELGYNPYSFEELRSLASKPVSSVSSVAVVSANGYTNTVVFSTNAGTISMTGNEFKTVYNLRAPGYLRIPQSGFVHVNIHKK